MSLSVFTEIRATGEVPIDLKLLRSSRELETMWLTIDGAAGKSANATFLAKSTTSWVRRNTR